MWKVGDFVTRHSYGGDIRFVIVGLTPDGVVATLKGIEVRLLADAPTADLMPATDSDLRLRTAVETKLERDALVLVEQRRRILRSKAGFRSERNRQDRDFFERPGRVLHLDGDGAYLDKCLKIYLRLGIRAIGKTVPESQMAARMPALLESCSPDILVITGHDGVVGPGRSTEVLNLEHYRNSDHFVKAVKAARRYERSLDELVIFAGACQSHYEALLEAGANFASSPERILIHALDPVFVAERVAYTPINETVDIFRVVRTTITGTDGLGGMETRGKYRIGLPRSRY
jgi:spore coat assembly protein